MENLVKVFKALSDETRIKILILVSNKNICHKGISKHLGISDSAVSQHIKVLKDANIIRGYKEGYYIIYQLNQDIFDICIKFIQSLGNEPSEYIKEKVNLKDLALGCGCNCKSIKKCCMRRG